MMRFKIDENVHPDVAALLRGLGHDAMTVHEQALRGAPDERLAEAVRREERILLTFDLGFADIRRHPPDQYAGIIVLRLASQHRAAQMTAGERVGLYLGGANIFPRETLLSCARLARFRDRQALTCARLRSQDAAG